MSFKKTRMSRLLLGGIFASAVAAPAAAVDDMFLKLEGVQGESLDKMHQGEIEILGYSQSLTSVIPTGKVPGMAGSAGRPTCNPVTITKFVDRSSPALILYAANGMHLMRGQITLRTQGQNPLEYYKIRMEEIVITEVEQSHTKISVPNPAPPRAMEKVTLMARRYIWEYTPQSPAGKAPGRGPSGWDCVTMSQQ